MSETSTPTTVTFEQTGAIARITLNRPEKLNAINHELGVELYDAFVRCQDVPSIRAIVLAGAGRAFCAGDEIAFRRRGSISHYVGGPGRWTATVKLMRSLSAPIICRIQGYAYGAGF